MTEDARLNSFRVFREAFLHLRFMRFLPFPENIGWIGFMLAVYDGVMIRTK